MVTTRSRAAAQVKTSRGQKARVTKQTKIPSCPSKANVRPFTKSWKVSNAEIQLEIEQQQAMREIASKNLRENTSKKNNSRPKNTNLVNMEKALKRIDYLYVTVKQLEDEVLATDLTDEQKQDFSTWLLQKLNNSTTVKEYDSILEDASAKIKQYNNRNARDNTCPKVSSAKSLMSRITLKKLLWFTFQILACVGLAFWISRWTNVSTAAAQSILSGLTHTFSRHLPFLEKTLKDPITEFAVESVIQFIASFPSWGAYKYNFTSRSIVQRNFGGNMFVQFIANCVSFTTKVVPDSIISSLSPDNIIVRMCGVFTKQKIGRVLETLFVSTAYSVASKAYRKIAVSQKECTLSIDKVKQSVQNIRSCAPKSRKRKRNATVFTQRKRTKR
jgi:hypothetical protein